jgi:hypothetical protein
MPDEIPIKQISKRKVLYVELDEEITSVYERIERLNYKDVYLVVPERAVLFQSVVNLSILKKKMNDIKKSLSIITSDSVGMKLAHQAEIPVFDQLRPPEASRTPISETPADAPEELHFPIAAASNEVRDDRPQRLREKKLSIFDVVKQAKTSRSFSIQALRERIDAFRKNRQLTKEPSRFALGAPSAKTLGTLVVASLCILLIISYIALPGATVTVIPRSNVVDQSVNITLADATRYGTRPSLGTPGHVLAYFPIDTTIEKSLTYTATGQIFDGTNAAGSITVINERGTQWPLVAFTRFQTEDGYVFRTQEAVTVPRANIDGPGTIEVPVLADEVDAYGRVIGQKGNIGPSSFVLPGLREESQKELYARSSTAFTGGTTLVTLKVTQEDLDASSILMGGNLASSREQVLLDEVTHRNSLNQTNLELLTGYNSIFSEEPNISIPSYLVESIQDDFEVKGSLEVSGFAFNQDEFQTILREELLTRKSPDKTLVRLDPDSISYEIFEVGETPGQIKLTATLKGIEAYDLNPEDESGARLIKKIKEHIAGKPVKEAEDYVQNLPEVNKVTISSWPVWAPTIPTVFENIEIKMDEKSFELLVGGNVEE